MYEDYMQNMFHTYDPYSRNIGYDYDTFYGYEPVMPYDYIPRTRGNFLSDLDDLYPEIYKIVYPMIKKACSQVTKSIDENLLDELTQEVYSHIETNNNTKVPERSQENRSVENRQSSNPILRDLIRILLIRELGGSPSSNRPPIPPRPPFPNQRPPMPPYPGPRPPTPPRINNPK